MSAHPDAHASTDGAVPDLSPAELQNLLAERNAPPLLLDLWAPWCQPCLAQGPALQRLAAVTEGRLRVVKLDTQKHPEIAQSLNVRGIPLLVMFRDGREVSRRVGQQSFESLCAWMEEADNTLVDTTAPAFRPPPPLGGAFYGDSGLRHFLVDRLLALAAQGKIDPMRFPVWGGDRGTVSCALVRHADPQVFARVTGLPTVVGYCLHFAGITTAEALREVFDALPAGAEARGLAPRLLLRWLGDEALPWSAHLGPAGDSVRQDWLTLTQAWLHGEPPLPDTWATLADRARTLTQDSDTTHIVADHFGRMISRLSPPPSDDSQDWTSLFLMYGTYLRLTLPHRTLGWTDTHFAHEVLRERWFKARCPNAAALTPEEMQDLRARYMADHGEAEAAQDRLIADSAAGHAQHLSEAGDRLRAQLITCLRELQG